MVELVSMNREQLGEVEGLLPGDVTTLLRVIEENVEVVEEEEAQESQERHGHAVTRKTMATMNRASKPMCRRSIDRDWYFPGYYALHS